MAGRHTMVKKADVAIIDSNVFIIDLRYQGDRNFAVNSRFLKLVAARRCGVVSLVNLLEIVGILSFNLNERQLLEFYGYFPRRYNIEVVPSISLDAHLPELKIKDIMDVMTLKASFGDALTIASVASYIPHASYFVTWDKEHFSGKMNAEVITPAEFLRR